MLIPLNTGLRGGGLRQVLRAAEPRFLSVEDVIRRRGENISSREVESAVRAHPAVADVAAFPVPSELAEDEVMVAAVPAPGQVLDLRDLVGHCAEELPPCAVPRYIDTVRELPLTETGKVRKAALRERGVTATTWDLFASPTPARHQT
ncbi:AMP-binding enzyme [Streptomyces sp. 3213.3]|uniref:AMP-binding enzyme n=1 Tax=Streptomyces sp. 3213.3 TaxID=1855348 RepID=UPI000A97F6C5|nr:hypothetical protein [Streptomyces sp. 3213.3]